MVSQLKTGRSYAKITLDVLAFFLAVVLAFSLRFDFDISPPVSSQLIYLLCMAVPLKLAVFFYFRVYSGMYRYFGIRDAVTLTQAVLISSLLLVIVVFLIHHLGGFSRTVFVLDGALTLIFTGGVRFATRVYRSQGMLPPLFGGKRNGGRNIVIIGAGAAGEKLLREIYDNSALSGYNVVGFLDDDRQKHGGTIHGVKIVGGMEKLAVMRDRHGVLEALIAIPSATSTDMQKIVSACRHAQVHSQTLPGLGEIVRGEVSLKQLRDVSYEDLLGRESVDLDNPAIAKYLRGQTVLVTGAGGSIGAELCHRICEFQPALLLLLDASEENLFKIETRLKQDHPEKDFLPILGSIVDAALVEKIYARYSPQIVFHAAAYKHVPMVERNPWEAVSNNIRGSQVVMELAVKHGVERFVLVSSDKAVRPTNVMGASKRVTEMLTNLFQGGGTRFIAVRFGNVVGSSGSVVPLFREQIRRGGPVTVTHPDVTRYFMMISEAAQLIIQAGALGRGGEVFILNMGRAVKIAQMAEDLIRLSGREPHRDVQIVFTGLREGEKIQEELITQGENIVPTGHSKIMVLRDDDLEKGHGGAEGYREWLNERLSALYESASNYDAPEVKTRLAEIVSEYTAQENKGVL